VRHGTYSIVARDATGALGVAVQSHWFSVGSLVTWGEPGVGAGATQSIPDAAIGPAALDALRDGAGAEAALARALAEDPELAMRQVGVVDAHGGAAAHTGDGCIPHAAHVLDRGLACQSNMMRNPGVSDAMAEAFRVADGQPLAERLLLALEAAEGVGGDVRGRQSSALLVLPASGRRWDRTEELRVEDHEDPVGELRRLHVLHRAYALADEGDALLAAGRFEEAGAAFAQASSLAPQATELLFWAGLGAAQAGDFDAGVEQVREAIAQSGRWGELLDRLEPHVAPVAADVRARLGRG
jgi:uncharacterized Ntn-hydrolase superfamily protein